MTEIKILGPRAEVDDALRELLYGSTKFSINRIADGSDTEASLAAGEREVTLDYPRIR